MNPGNHDLAVQKLLKSAFSGEMSTFPTPLHAMARHLGVAGVVNTNEALGCVDLSLPRPVIRLATELTGNRRRFTLAHELGHVVLHQAQPSHLSIDDVERFCDRLAVEMLLPTPWVTPLVHRQWTLSELEDFARQAEVSVAVLVNRLSDLGGNAVWLRLERVPSQRPDRLSNTWCVTERAGAKGPFRSYVGVGHDSANALSDIPDGMYARVLQLDLAGRIQRFHATLRKRRTNAWVSLDRRSPCR